MSNFILFDDSDPLFQYSGDWNTNHTGVEQAVNKTLHCTNVEGSTVLFPFNGTGFEVMTVLFFSPEGEGADTVYTVDGKNSFFLSEGTRKDNTQPRFNDSSFRGVGLSPGSHVLNITHRNGFNGSIRSLINTYCLDYVRVELQPSGSFDLGGVTLTMPIPTGRGDSSTASHVAPMGGSLGGTVGLVLITVLAFLTW